jgi:hypothetical protein
MLILAVCLVAVAHSLPQAPAGEQKPLEPPTWFLETSLEGKFAERSAECKKLFPEYESVASKGPIFIPEDADADICINFPAKTITREDGTTRELPQAWRHDRGSKGACSNGCCEFRPPTKSAPAPVDHPSWFETSSDCSNPTNVVEGSPILYQGKNGDEKNICILKEDGYEFTQGALGNCGGACCIFYPAPEE